jgi:hypothetical protein
MVTFHDVGTVDETVVLVLVAKEPHVADGLMLRGEEGVEFGDVLSARFGRH